MASEYPPLKITDRPIKISVISPTYNHGHFLRQNLDGILSQTYSNFELIIVNDGSTDDTHSIISEYANKDPRIIYRRLEKNEGVMIAFETGYQMATGDLIYPTASDDHLTTPTFFETVVRLMQKVPQAAGAFGQAEMILSDANTSMGLLGGIRTSTSGYIPPKECMECFLDHRALIPGVSAIWRRDLVDKIGGYPTDIGPQHDYFVNHALAALAGVIFIPQKVAVHRMSDRSYNANVEARQRIRNYCLVEKKMRGLNLHAGIASDLFISWRDRLLDSILVAKLQKQMFDVFRQVVASMEPTFWSHVPETQKKFFKSIPSECERLEKDLFELKAWGMQEFERIAES